VRSNARELTRFIDAVREVLGLAPLRGEAMPRPDGERFARTYPERAHAAPTYSRHE
jgi:hypothetical protein